MKGRTIRIYLVDGVPAGILTAEIINWTGSLDASEEINPGELTKDPVTGSWPPEMIW
jgi:hypothetical protein